MVVVVKRRLAVRSGVETMMSVKGGMHKVLGMGVVEVVEMSGETWVGMVVVVKMMDGAAGTWVETGIGVGVGVGVGVHGSVPTVHIHSDTSHSCLHNCIQPDAGLLELVGGQLPSSRICWQDTLALRF